MQYQLDNESLSITVAQKGAELQSVYGKETGLHYLWSGDPQFWGKHSPVLFPIVGTLKDNVFYYEGKKYTMGRHGFARDSEFTLRWQKPDALCLRLQSNPDTLKNFPFPFLFDLRYELAGSDLIVTYTVENTGTGPMYFSVGGHPAFRLPLVEGTAYDDYYLEFNEDETKPRWPISPQGLIEKTPVPLLQSTAMLPLSKSLFAQDALVLKGLSSSMVSLLSYKTSHGLDFDFSGFPYLGIWAARGADFVCIEPWCGIADPVDSDQDITRKEGIEKLSPGMQFERSWRVSFF